MKRAEGIICTDTAQENFASKAMGLDRQQAYKR
jgi:hypothetical protein